jgi:nicotinamidase-related amidase
MYENSDLHGNAPDESEIVLLLIDLLLKYLRARTLILTGIAGNNCVLFTANDAYLRDYKLIIPADCTASIQEEDNDNALRQMQDVLKANVRPSGRVDFAPQAVQDEGRTRAARS